jgi:hypothetical protein
LTPVNLVLRWIDMIGYMFFSLVWCLPFSGWLVLVSARAKSVPLIWVVGIPLFVLLLEGIFTSSDLLWNFVGAHMMARYSAGQGIVVNPYSLETVVALVVGVGFVAAAVWCRGHAEEI